MTATLVLGGARSGKTGHALELARGSGLTKFMIVTAPPRDESMAPRIARHRAEREDDGWTVFEEETDIARVARRIARPGRVVVIDCLTLWLSNLFFQERDMLRETERLAAVLADAEGEIVAISNELGLGVSPATQIGNDFRDAQGLVNQRIARACAKVFFVAAGLPLKLK